jgi:hypothetical protein
MHRYNLNDMTLGWFIGNFSPSLHPNPEFEVGIKRFSKGDKEPAHYQLIATEWTCVVKGSIRIGDAKFSENDIVEIPPLEVADFEALEDAILVVVKCPSSPSDKVIVDN